MQIIESPIKHYGSHEVNFKYTSIPGAKSVTFVAQCHTCNLHHILQSNTGELSNDKYMVDIELQMHAEGLGEESDWEPGSVEINFFMDDDDYDDDEEE